MISIDNLNTGETVPQRCLLVHGRVLTGRRDQTESISVFTTDKNGQNIFPQQQWPVCQGYFKALVMLSPGENQLKFVTSANTTILSTIIVTYIPLLQNPPLHLAILVAKDSPLLLDCPAAKRGALSSAHATVDAAITKLRMTAYMWQALVAETFHAQNLGRRTFRLEEEWAADTVSRDYIASYGDDVVMRSTAKVHLVRTEKTVAELRNARLAQESAALSSQNMLYNIFSKALQEHGGVFVSGARPIVAGLILDAHYSPDQNLILAHNAKGIHNSKGLSLGMTGSQLTYAWPRFVEEVSDCLLDMTHPGDLVADENGDCKTMWEACAYGQGHLLHHVCHAFGAPHNSCTMDGWYPMHWPRCFLSRTAHCVSRNTEGVGPITPKTVNDANLDIRELLRLRAQNHFSLPTDVIFKDAKAPVVTVEEPDDNYIPSLSMVVKGHPGIAKVWFNNEAEPSPTPIKPQGMLIYTLADLEKKYERSKPLMMEILDTNGNTLNVNVWKRFVDIGFFRVPGTNIKLLKQSVSCDQLRSWYTPVMWDWVVMLKKRNDKGKLIEAKKIDIRVGAIFDGAEVHYKDNTKIPCGPRTDAYGSEFRMGGNAQTLHLSRWNDIVKVRINHGGAGSTELQGMRIFCDDDQQMGQLHGDYNQESVTELEAGDDQEVIGFFGQSYRDGYCTEFGIITAPKGVVLPDSVFDLPELQNNDGGLVDSAEKKVAHRGTKRDYQSVQGDDPESGSDDDRGSYDECNDDEADHTMGEDEE